MNKFNYCLFSISLYCCVNTFFAAESGEKSTKNSPCIFGRVINQAYENIFDPNNPFSGKIILDSSAVNEFRTQMTQKVIYQQNKSWPAALNSFSVNGSNLQDYLKKYNLILSKESRKELNDVHCELKKQLDHNQQAYQFSLQQQLFWFQYWQQLQLWQQSQSNLHLQNDSSFEETEQQDWKWFGMVTQHNSQKK